jgi:hypothetical protein
MSVLLSLPLGVVVWALGNLIYLPALPRCFNARNAPPSDQLYCAEQIASGQRTEDLRRAMVVVNGVPREHPLRDDSDRLINFWGREILRRAAEEFDAGNLQTAVELAMQIPHQVDMRNRAVETVREWEDAWADAEDLYQQAEDYLDAGAWLRALETSRQLLQIDNQYWSTTRYRELIRTIQTSRETQQREDEKRDAKAANSGVGREDDTVDDFISRWEEDQERDDRARLQQARELANGGTVDGLRSAIAEAQQILYGTDSYDQAQQAIARWRSDIDRIQDQPYLDRAAQLASAGDWDGAIEEARNVSWDSHLYEEARDRISEWQTEADVEGQVEEPSIPAVPEELDFPSPVPDLPATRSEPEPVLAPFISPRDNPVVPSPAPAAPATPPASEPES